jgi:hypothetical protein
LVNGPQLLAILAIVIAGVISAALLRSAWNDRSASRVWMILGGWAVIAVALVAGSPFLGAARGLFIAASMIPVAALAFIATGMQVRQQRVALDKASIALEPSDRPSRAWRGVLRFLLAGPIGGLAAVGVGVMWTVYLPGDPQTRIVTSGLIIPVAWGALMAWTLSDDRIIRATAVLVGVAVFTFTAAYLRGFT